MAKLTRVPAKVFASSAAADEIGQFGSAVAGSKLETADVATIQGLSAWLDGWSEALVSGNRYPALQEMNGLLKVLSYQGAYTLQEGIAEYDSATTYFIGSIVKKIGTFEIYGSLTNDNVGNALTVDTEWQLLCILDKVVATTGDTMTGALNLSNTTQLSERIRLSGQEFYQANNTSSDGLSILNLVNRPTAKAIAFADSSCLTPNGTNIMGTFWLEQAAGFTISSVSTNSNTFKPLNFNASLFNFNNDIVLPNAKSYNAKDAGGTIRSILYVDPSNMINFGNENFGVKINTSTYLAPSLDNARSLGASGNRWSVVYAGTGTINTSDRNEKQQIEELSEAEKRVAVKLKTLIRKFKFNDSVVEKGDDARIHVGIIAQDVKQAFESEGLDASRYSIFCSDTWIDEETGEEKTRLGIRYEELLCFIISAI